MKVTVFQDYASSLSLGPQESNGEDDVNDAASLFFELANAQLIGYRVANDSSSAAENDAMVIIKQHSDAKAHTGGIIWETSYLLAAFLSSKFGLDRNKVDGDRVCPLGKTLEIGAGCGMLGLILAATKLASRVVMTEAAEVMDILTENVDQNKVETPTTNNESESDDDDKLSNNINGIHGTSSKPVCPEECVSVRRLRWDCLQEDVLAAAADNSSAQENDLKPNSFDTIVGTDVVFSPSLVCPLLETIKLMARKKDVESTKATRIYLCLQIRCADSHSLLFSEAHKYGLEVVDVTGELTSCCPWAVELECLLLKINVKEEMATHGKKRKKCSKEKKSKKKDKKSRKRRKKE
mmetsp:Transcript_14138/g.21306  ORF Transcript_14138/g.21306 Transcript_14138/m.21306 type:complete len:351 (+) Transcript_14138:58-1110(+)